MSRRCVVCAIQGWLALSLLVAIGCEKLPWAPHAASNKNQGAAASPTPSSLVVPSQPSVLPNDLLANVNGVPISKYDLEFRIQELKGLMANFNQPWKSLSAQQLGDLLDQLINNELMNQDAVARGLERSTETQRRWAFTRRAFFVQEWLRWNQQRFEVNTAEIEQFYEKNKLGFRVPERRQLRQLVVSSESQAKQALSQLLAGSMEFATLVKQISEGPTASEGGLLSGWVMRANEKAFLYATEADAEAAGVLSLDPALEAAAFAIDQENGLSNYVKGSDNRFHLFQMVKREESRQRPLTEAWDQIKNLLTVQALQQTMEALRTKAKIERFPDRLDAVTQ
ncbi:MAG: peptidyl-prolyl cis-trans isomerase [Candidatus Omnitrophica bacterium]|nr:peptidyl-prolyl cis-trans isomerase [Candidatus Omnitrophota bacterium]